MVRGYGFGSRIRRVALFIGLGRALGFGCLGVDFGRCRVSHFPFRV